MMASTIVIITLTERTSSTPYGVPSLEIRIVFFYNFQIPIHVFYFSVD